MMTLSKGRPAAFFILAAASLITVSGCESLGGSSTTSSSSSSSGSSGTKSGPTGTPVTTSTEAGVATVKALSTIPSVDISNLDYSLVAAAVSADLSAPKHLVMKRQSAGDGKRKSGLGTNMNEEGNASRAGCESNVHKKEMIRHSQMAQLDRCYPEAMERALPDVFYIPDDGNYAFFKIKPPSGDDDRENRIKACDGIPKERTKEIEQCKKGDEGPGGGEMRIRIGEVDGELRVDMCEGEQGLTSEATYKADGKLYTIDALRIGKFNGNTDKSHFHATADLGTTGTVTKGVTDLGDGNVVASSAVNGAFGSGALGFKADGAAKTNTVDGIFKGGFEDPMSGITTTFTGSAHAVFNATTGCAKFRFEGGPPPMAVKNMIPFDIPEDQLDEFLTSFGGQMGINLTTENYKTVLLCPNPDFDPENPDNSGGAIPMIELEDTTSSCPSVVHAGVECFSIASGVEEAGGGVKDVTQVFTIIANDAAAFFTEVNAYDLAQNTDASETIAFSRNWDCDGEFSEIDFAKFTRTQMQAVEKEISECMKIEAKARRNEGMGGHDCNDKQMQGDVDNFAKEGGPQHGKFDGNLDITGGGTCPAGSCPEHLFINPVDPDNNKYCLALPRTCADFTVTGTSATGLDLDVDNGVKVTAIGYTQSGNDPASKVTITFLASGVSVTANYTVNQASFDKPPAFDPNAVSQNQGGGGQPGPGGELRPGDQGFMPASCIDAGLTTETACRAHCMESQDCRD